MKIGGICVAVLCILPSWLSAQDHSYIYVGALGGLATLSGDGQSEITGSSAATSLYDPENGGAASIFSGYHFSRYASFQGNYIWNRNDVTLVSTLSNPAGSAYYQQPMTSTEHAFIGDLLVYFRPRGNRIRPYLSQGGGGVHLTSRVNGSTVSSGGLLMPPGNSTSVFFCSRTAVGLDVGVGHAWYFRYTFGENISHNPLSSQLSPPGQRLLKNFQNLFGLYRTF